MVRNIAVMVERTCDNCGKKVEYNDMQISELQKSELCNWFAVAREVFGDTPQPVRLLYHCCSKACVGQLVMMDPQVQIPQGAAN